MRISLNYYPRPWQRTVHSSLKRFNVLALHRRAGKSMLGIMELIDRALKCDLELGNFIYLAPFKVQARTIAWEILKAKILPLSAAGLCDINEGALTIVFKHNKATIRLLGGDDPHALRGMRIDFIVLDEVAQIKPELWIEVIQPALADRMGGAILIGTPFGVNLFSDLYFSAAGKPDWYCARFTCYDTNALSSEEIERLKAVMSEVSFARELLCDFGAAGDDQLISLTDVELAVLRQYKPGEMDYASRILGVDVSRFGNDRSVAILRQGLQVFDPAIWRGLDNMDLAARIAEIINRSAVDATFIDVGGGAGVIDRLRQLGYDVFEVNFGGKPADGKYKNKRAEMWDKMAEGVVSGLAIPNITSLKLELCTPKYFYDATNRFCLESKDEIKKRMPEGASPDIADALCLTYASPVVKRSLFDKRASEDYNPYEKSTVKHIPKEHNPYA